MKNRMFMFAMAAMLSLGTVVSASAADNAAAGCGYVDANQDGICDNFADANQDGICDRFVDKDGDGFNDNCIRRRMNAGACGAMGRMCGRTARGTGKR